MATLTGSGVNFSDGTVINGTTANTVGSYASVRALGLQGSPFVNYTFYFGSNYAVGGSAGQVNTYPYNGGISGTWRWMAGTVTVNWCSCGQQYAIGIAVRVA